VTERCPYCDTPNDGEIRDDCCSDAEAAALRAENARLRAELAALEHEFRYAAGLIDD
jgi:hypothetical protein